MLKMETGWRMSGGDVLPLMFCLMCPMFVGYIFFI